MKKSDLKNKVVSTTLDYFGDPVKLGIRVNFVDSALEAKVGKLSSINEAEMTEEDVQNTAKELAAVCETIVEWWDIEDSEPVAAEFIDIGIMLMIKVIEAAREVVAPGKAPGAA